MNMSGELSPQPFDFQGSQVRFVGTSESPEWVGADVVAVLYPEAERSSYNKYLDGVPAEWKGKKKVLTPGGAQDMLTLFEPGLYALIARSNSPIAVPFQKWVYEEVLPSIRQTGSYAIVQPQPQVLIPPPKERLEGIRLGMDLLYELGGIDERTQLALKDIVRDILLEDKLKKPALPGGGRSEWPVSDRARHLGFRPKRADLIKIGRVAAELYRLRHEGQDPPKREQHVDGATRMVMSYGEADLDILDQAISLVMNPPAQLPPVDDSDEDV
jgi:prophage antirepressor-like protein